MRARADKWICGYTIGNDVFQIPLLEKVLKSLPLGPKTMKFTLLHLKNVPPAAGLFFKDISISTRNAISYRNPISARRPNPGKSMRARTRKPESTADALSASRNWKPDQYCPRSNGGFLESGSVTRVIWDTSRQ